MKIGIIQASSQKDKNSMMERCVKEATKDQDYEIINFGVYDNGDESLSYIQIALCISMLLESKAVDFIVTGCSSGQGMMLACNSLPGVMCGYVENVSDAYLFGRINNGNAISYPLGLSFGWAAEINLVNTIKSLFNEPLGMGYPPEDAERKRRDSEQLRVINRASKRKLTELLPLLDSTLVQGALNYDVIYEYIIEHGQNNELKAFIKQGRR
jgi:ribose 5-phosphate isomerase RpiB